MAERSVSGSPHPAYDLDWNLIRSFEAVASAGSLAGGARLLGIAHPTIARHIQNLEEHLGVALFSRTKQGLVLNSAGERLLRTAELMQEHALAFQNAADTLDARPVASVRITVSEMMAEILPHLALPSVLEADGAMPALEMIVTNDQLNLLDRDADIALRHARPDQQELIARQLGGLPVGLFASAAYLHAFGQVSEEAAGQHRFVDGAERPNLLNGARRAGLAINPDQVVFRSDSLACQRAAVLAGWGVGAFPSMVASTVDGLLPAMAPEYQVLLDVWLVARPEVRDNAQLKQVFDGVGNALNQHFDAVMRA